MTKEREKMTRVRAKAILGDAGKYAPKEFTILSASLVNAQASVFASARRLKLNRMIRIQRFEQQDAREESNDGRHEAMVQTASHTEDGKLR